MAKCSDPLDKLRANLNILQLDCQNQSRVFRECVEGLLNIYRMILNHPNEEKYRNIAVEKFERKWSKPAMKQLLMEAGWTAEGDRIVFTGGDMINLKDVIKILADVRVSALPNASEWIPESKVERINYNRGQFDEAEQRLRLAGASERDRELSQWKAEKIESLRIAENIRKEIRSDNDFKKLSQSSKSEVVPAKAITHSAERSTQKS